METQCGDALQLATPACHRLLVGIPQAPHLGSFVVVPLPQKNIFVNFLLWKILDIDKGRKNSKTFMFPWLSFSSYWFIADRVLYIYIPTLFPLFYLESNDTDTVS